MIVSPLAPAPAPLRKLAFSTACLCFGVATDLAVLLSWRSLASREALPGCGGPQACGSVTASRWAYLGPIPVALPAAVLYGLILGGPCWLALRRAASTLRTVSAVWTAVATFSLVAIGAAGWFAVLLVFVLHQLCPYCLATHGCALLGSVLVLSLARGHQRTQRWNWVGPGTAARRL